MAKINTISLNDTITIFTQSGSFDMYGQPASWAKTESPAAIFNATSSSRDNYKPDTDYDDVIYSLYEADQNSLIYKGSTTETDPTSLTTYEVEKVLPMKKLNQTIVGWKIWL